MNRFPKTMSSKCLNLLTSLTLAAGNAQAIACTYDPGVNLDASHEVTLTFRGPTAPDDIKPIEFDPKTWAIGATDYEVKVAMFKGFLEKHELNGMTEAKVFALLGHGLAKGPAGYHGDVGWVVHGLMGNGPPTENMYGVMIVFKNGTVEKWYYVKNGAENTSPQEPGHTFASAVPYLLWNE